MNQRTTIDSSLQNDRARRLKGTMIPPRFQTKSLLNWIAGTDEQKKALVTANKFTKNYQNSMGLILIGPPGTGKNHMACGVIRDIVQNSSETALICSALKILRSIKDSWRKDGEGESKVLAKYRDVGILVIDEIGVQFGTNTEWIYINEIINDRYEWLKPTILISNLALPELKELLGDRVIDRFKEGGNVIVFDWESRRGK